MNLKNMDVQVLEHTPLKYIDLDNTELESLDLEKKLIIIKKLIQEIEKDYVDDVKRETRLPDITVDKEIQHDKLLRYIGRLLGSFEHQAEVEGGNISEHLSITKRKNGNPIRVPLIDNEKSILQARIEDTLEIEESEIDRTSNMIIRLAMVNKFAHKVQENIDGSVSSSLVSRKKDVESIIRALQRNKNKITNQKIQANQDKSEKIRLKVKLKASRRKTQEKIEQRNKELIELEKRKKKLQSQKHVQSSKSNAQSGDINEREKNINQELQELEKKIKKINDSLMALTKNKQDYSFEIVKLDKEINKIITQIKVLEQSEQVYDIQISQKQQEKKPLDCQIDLVKYCREHLFWLKATLIQQIVFEKFDSKSHSPSVQGMTIEFVDTPSVKKFPVMIVIDHPELSYYVETHMSQQIFDLLQYVYNLKNPINKNTRITIGGVGAPAVYKRKDEDVRRVNSARKKRLINARSGQIVKSKKTAQIITRRHRWRTVILVI